MAYLERYHHIKTKIPAWKCEINVLIIFLQSSNCMGFIIPDSSVEFALFDRVVSCRENYTVPLGLSGTIIGIIENAANKDSDVLYEVIFDEEFTGAAKKCGIASCYTLTGTSIINRSYGLREYQRKVGKPGNVL